MRNLLVAVFGLFFLAGCAAESIWADDEFVARTTYRHNGPPEITLFTMINNNSGAGAHSSLMVAGSQRVIFDPAGSFKHKAVPERNDVILNASPAVVDGYTRYHARQTFRVKVQTVSVSPEVAEGLIRAVMQNGAVPPAQCALSTSSILSQFFPGKITRGWYPLKLAEEFDQLPGVKTRVLREYDSDDNTKVLEEWDPKRYRAEKALLN